jgi:hypothetical protein
MLKNNSFLYDDLALQNLIIFDSIILLLISLAPKNITTHEERLMYAITHYAVIKDEMCTHTPKTIFDKNYIELHKTMYSIECVILGKKSVYFADASSNALQLVALTRGTSNRMLLELLNIINNTTNYRNIYYYILEELKKLDYNLIIGAVDEITVVENSILFDKGSTQINNGVIQSLLSVEIIKYMIMPAAYGKTQHTNFKTCNQHLIETNNYVWSYISPPIKKKICLI